MTGITFILVLPVAVAVLFIAYYGKDTLAYVAGYEKPSNVMTITPPVIAEKKETTETNVPILFGDQDEAVDFLEEVLPVTTPDPNRVRYDAVETDASGSKNLGTLSVKDTSDSGLDLNVEKTKEIDLGIESLDEPVVLIYHTHSCESYMKNFTGFYYADEAFRSEDSNKNIAVVGEAMKNALEEMGIKTIHDTTLHDSPAFNGAYDRSAETVQSYLEKYPSIKITIDVHRDAMTTDTGLSYKPTTSIDGKKAAQMMIIAGSDPTGELDFDNWYPNLLFALKLQEQGETDYNGLMRPLMFCQRSYNMWLTDSSFLVEVGTQMNTFSEVEYSGTLMGKILGEVIKKYQ